MTSILEKSVRSLTVAAGFAIALAVIASPAAAEPQDVPMSVRLTSTLNLAGAPIGQSIMGEVLSPDSFKGDVLKGKVTQANISHGKATVEFQFEYIQHSGHDYAVMAKIISVQNSKGQQSLDEQGKPLRATTVPGKGPKQRKFGGNIGGIAGMPTSSPGDPQSNDDFPPSIRVAGEGSDSSLAIGSMMVLSVRSNGLGDLTSLRPNGPVEDPYALPNPAEARPSPLAAPTSLAGQPAMKLATIEFIPGERTIFFDDFSNVGADGVPARWPIHDGRLELRTRDGVPVEEYAAENVSLTSPEMIVPANFTFELEWTGSGVMEWNFRNGKNVVLTAVVHGDLDGKFVSVQILAADGSALGSGKAAADTSKPFAFELWAQQRRMGIYLDGQRMTDVDEFHFAAINHFDQVETKFRDVAIHKVRVSETAPDFSSVINASGKFITHGIEFDADSDHLKPESAAVLKEIAAAMAKDPSLKLEIDVYTDSEGDADRNVKLSAWRAEAVRSILEAQFGVAATRLTAHGFGPAKPLASNDNPEGRAANRRVELVKK